MFIRNFALAVAGWCLLNAGTAAHAAPGDCSGLYSITAAGFVGTLELQDSGWNEIVGTITWADPRYGVSAVNGTCTLQGRGGNISFSRPDANQLYSGVVTRDFGGASMSGNFVMAGRSYPWSASTLAGPEAQVCEGDYRLVANTVPGTLEIYATGQGIAGQIIWDDPRFGVSEVSGNCRMQFGRGSISFYRPDAAQNYSANLSIVGGRVVMSGSFLGNGQYYPWSATSLNSFSIGPVTR